MDTCLHIFEILFWAIGAVVLAIYSLLFIINLGDLGLSVFCLMAAYGSIFMAYRHAIKNA